MPSFGPAYRPTVKRPDLLVNHRMCAGATNLRGHNQKAVKRWVARHEDAEASGGHNAYFFMLIISP
ncbi:hypothetical protein BEN47_13450 [Hymenobacter lapidarius]|uniref:Uncharacterized protein n=1 Tax=Hymenobacter lapidarius TaxID=1908237 RepID=A0A1G1T5F4_9BACT|nr:hypothetical protein [Hymenobacter lapidarius]OGX86103.1 hypothetical protein BEN47_13450 [Hymenobacter lapidarius]